MIIKIQINARPGKFNQKVQKSNKKFNRWYPFRVSVCQRCGLALADRQVL